MGQSTRCILCFELHRFNFLFTLWRKRNQIRVSVLRKFPLFYWEVCTCALNLEIFKRTWNKWETTVKCSFHDLYGIFCFSHCIKPAEYIYVLIFLKGGFIRKSAHFNNFDSVFIKVLNPNVKSHREGGGVLGFIVLRGYCTTVPYLTFSSFGILNKK